MNTSDSVNIAIHNLRELLANSDEKTQQSFCSWVESIGQGKSGGVIEGNYKGGKLTINTRQAVS